MIRGETLWVASISESQYVNSVYHKSHTKDQGSNDIRLLSSILEILKAMEQGLQNLSKVTATLDLNQPNYPSNVSVE